MCSCLAFSAVLYTILKLFSKTVQLPAIYSEFISYFSQSYHQWILRKVLKPRSDISSVIAFSVFIPKNLANLSVVSLAFKQLFIFKSLSSIILNLDSDRQTDRRRNIKKYQAIWSVCKWFQYSLSQKKYGIYSMGGTDKIQTGVKTKNASIN